VVRAKPKQKAGFIAPMAAQPVAALPEGAQWLYEPKLDGSPYSSIVTDSRMVF